MTLAFTHKSFRLKFVVSTPPPPGYLKLGLPITLYMRSELNALKESFVLINELDVNAV